MDDERVSDRKEIEWERMGGNRKEKEKKEKKKKKIFFQAEDGIRAISV